MYTCIYVYNIHIYVYTCIHICIYLQIHIYIYTYRERVYIYRHVSIEDNIMFDIIEQPYPATLLGNLIQHPQPCSYLLSEITTDGQTFIQSEIVTSDKDTISESGTGFMFLCQDGY